MTCIHALQRCAKSFMVKFSLIISKHASGLNTHGLDCVCVCMCVCEKDECQQNQWAKAGQFIGVTFMPVVVKIEISLKVFIFIESMTSDQCECRLCMHED